MESLWSCLVPETQQIIKINVLALLVQRFLMYLSFLKLFSFQSRFLEAGWRLSKGFFWPSNHKLSMSDLVTNEHHMEVSGPRAETGVDGETLVCIG